MEKAEKRPRSQNWDTNFNMGTVDGTHNRWKISGLIEALFNASNFLSGSRKFYKSVVKTSKCCYNTFNNSA